MNCETPNPQPMTIHQTSSHLKRGFTLVELLAVITIILVQAVLPVGVIVGLRDQADSANRIRNIAQLQIVKTSCAADHNGSVVPIGSCNDQGARNGFRYQNPDFLSKADFSC
jgi:prepilin-type N-terminal cleavage/methylation domain-containing protein